MTSTASGEFKFRKHVTVGAYAAEDDATFLTECFIDTGDLAILRDLTKPERIIIGRTGSGKTALLTQLRRSEDRAIQIRPEHLSLNHISNSTVLRFFTELGVHLDLFYKLLWTHVFAVELLREHFGLVDEASKRRAFDPLWFTKGASRKRKAASYLAEYGDKFWEETEYRVKEVTQRIEDQLSDSLKGVLGPATVNLQDVSKFSTEEKAEIAHRGQSVVNDVQVHRLEDVLVALREEFEANSQLRYFLVIDRLDEGWVDDSIKNALIRALVETLREFANAVPQAKIVIGLRTDLVERVFRDAPESSLSREKLRSICLPISWRREPLIGMLDTRIEKLVRDSYTTATVTHKELLPSPKRRKRGQEAIDYIIDRTMLRPRDLIHFFNCCIEQAEDRPQITKDMLQNAEGRYSSERLEALADEWRTDYPQLDRFIRTLFRSSSPHFPVGNLDTPDMRSRCEAFYIQNYDAGVLSEFARSFAERTVSFEHAASQIVSTLYRVGFAGLKVEKFDAVQWSFMNLTTTPPMFDMSSRLEIHPAFYRVLGIPSRFE